MRTGAEIVADQLVRLGFKAAFHVPGEGLLELLDALALRHPDLRLVTCRNEAGMAFMASGAARASGGPALCLAARAPGALNTSLALHTAMTDAVPVLMIIGQASMANFERESFLDTDLHRAFAPLAKWVALVNDVRRLPEMLSRAVHMATSGRHGPVVLILPEDVLQAQADVTDLARPPPRPEPAPGAAEVADLKERLARAERPLMLLGGSGWTATDCERLQDFAAVNDVPVAVAYRRRDLFENDHACFAGEIGIGVAPAVAKMVANADLLVAVNIRLGELNTIGGGFHGFGLLQPPRPVQQLVHFHPSASELNAVFQADVAAVASPAGVAAALATLRLPQQPARRAWRAQARAQWSAYVEGGTCPGPLDLKAIYTWLRSRLARDTIVAVGAGAYALWPQRYFSYHALNTQLGPKSGAMGYGVPAAIGAAIATGRRAVAIGGDGCFMMNAEELATAVQERLPLITLVANNGAYGAIRHTQLRMFGRSTGTDLANPDFVAFAHSFGAHAERVETTAEFAPAFERCAAQPGPSVIELRVRPEATRPGP